MAHGRIERPPHQRIVGDYIIKHQIGAGSFAVVWKAEHRLHGNEVAIKEIATEKLNKKLQENLMSEIAILKRTVHPNIIRLYDIVTASHRIFLVLEYCAGGDLAAYIQQCGRVSGAVARHLMCQLGAGLQVLRANNLIHRDLKPQNLLLSRNDGNAVLKIADFGFARSLQPQGMAETLCGSPLYMAPEILQSKRYDAKADLWSVGTILYQLVTGQPPFLGQSPAQLLRNIEKSNDLQFPAPILAELHPDCLDLCRKLLRRNPVERLSFEEFFNHNFIAQPLRHPADLIPEGNPFASDTSKRPQEDSLPFLLDEEPQVVPTSPSTSKQNMLAVSPSFSFLLSPGERTSTRNSTERRVSYVKEKESSFNHVTGREIHTKVSSNTNFKSDMGLGSKPVAAEVPDEGQESFQTSSSKGALLDSMECLEKEYVVVNAPLTSIETLSLSASDQSIFLGHQSPSKNPHKCSAINVSMPKPSGVIPFGTVGMGGSPGSASQSFHGSLDSAGVADAPFIHPPRRLQSLRNCAQVIAELANEKLHAGHHLEAFTIQLVCLAIWKEALNVCQKWANAPSGCGSHPRDEIGSMGAVENSQSSRISLPFSETFDEEGGVAAACSDIEQKFFLAVEHAERLAPHLYSLDGNAEIPDAMDIIYQAALLTGRNAAVDELMENMASAAVAYSKAATLLHFLLVEAALLPLTPRLVLSSSDRQRLRQYIDILIARHSQCAAQTVHLQQHHE